MNGIKILKFTFIFLFYILLQGLVFKHFIFFDTAMCFIYLIFLLQLPNDTPKAFLLIIGFITGLAADSLYDTQGIQAASCVLIMYLRPTLIKLLTPSGDYDNVTNISIQDLGINWFIVYTLILVFIHHFFMFMLESGFTGFFLWTVLKIVFSTILTSFFVISFSFLFHSKSK